MKALLTLVMLLTLIACSESQNTESTDQVNAGIELPLPDGMADMRVITFNNLYAEVTINNDDPLPPFPYSTPISISYLVQPSDTLNIKILWYEELPELPPESNRLSLASYTITEKIEKPVNLAVLPNRYTTDTFDRDSDGISNMAERIAGSNPLDRNDPRPPTNDGVPTVRINSIDPAQAPIIDGFYDSPIYDSATFNDDFGEELRIDNLMIDQGAGTAEEASKFRWFAMHDNTYLYLYVFGATSTQEIPPIRDSAEPHQDDSIEIFIDGDNSKGDAYDGVNDRQIIIPLLTSMSNPVAPNTSLFRVGDTSASVPPFEFATCVCSNDDAAPNRWEIKLPLAGLGIALDTPFGFDVQLNDDRDGGSRDGKWGWAHPPRNTVDVDYTFKIPSYMGTAVIRNR